MGKANSFKIDSPWLDKLWKTVNRYRKTLEKIKPEWNHSQIDICADMMLSWSLAERRSFLRKLREGK